jgi:hypothetical protein
MSLLAAEYAGHVTGGWGYVTAAYGLTWLGIIGYATSLFLRKKERP